MNYGINYGRKTSLLSGLGAALADLTYALLGFGFSYSYGLVAILQSNQKFLNFFSAIILIAFGVYMLVSAWRKKSERSEGTTSEKPPNALLTTYLLAVVNPLTILLFVAFATDMQSRYWGEVFVNAFAVFV